MTSVILPITPGGVYALGHDLKVHEDFYNVTYPFDFGVAQSCSSNKSAAAATSVITGSSGPTTIIHIPCLERLAVPTEIFDLQPAWNACPRYGAIDGYLADPPTALTPQAELVTSTAPTPAVAPPSHASITPPPETTSAGMFLTSMDAKPTLPALSLDPVPDGGKSGSIDNGIGSSTTGSSPVAPTPDSNSNSDPSRDPNIPSSPQGDSPPAQSISSGAQDPDTTPTTDPAPSLPPETISHAGQIPQAQSTSILDSGLGGWIWSAFGGLGVDAGGSASGLSPGLIGLTGQTGASVPTASFGNGDSPTESDSPGHSGSTGSSDPSGSGGSSGDVGSSPDDGSPAKSASPTTPVSSGVNSGPSGSSSGTGPSVGPDSSDISGSGPSRQLASSSASLDPSGSSNPPGSSDAPGSSDPSRGLASSYAGLIATSSPDPSGEISPSATTSSPPLQTSAILEGKAARGGYGVVFVWLEMITILGTVRWISGL